MFTFFNNFWDLTLSECSMPFIGLSMIGWSCYYLFIKADKVEQGVQTPNELLEKLIGDRLLEEWSNSQTWIITPSMLNR